MKMRMTIVIALTIIVMTGCTENNYTLYEAVGDTDSDVDSATGSDADNTADSATGTGAAADTVIYDTSPGPEIIIATSDTGTGTDAGTDTDTGTGTDAGTDAGTDDCIDKGEMRFQIDFKMVHVTEAIQGTYLRCSIPEDDENPMFTWLYSGVWEGSAATMNCIIAYCEDDTDNCYCANALNW